MGRRKKAERAEKKNKKKIVYTPIERTNAGRVTQPYKIMEKLVEKHHSELLKAEARILMAWEAGPAKEDSDGRTKVGRVKLGSDLDRHRGEEAFDILIMLRRELWTAFSEERQVAEIDRLLCRVGIRVTSEGEVYEDEKGASVFRLRKPLEVFPENVARFGLYQDPKLADCIAHFNDAQRPLLKGQDKGEAATKGKRSKKAAVPAGATSTTTPGGVEANGQSEANAQPPNGEAQSEEEATSKSPAAWRATTIDDLKLPGYVHKSLTKAGLWTLGEIETFEQANGDDWWKTAGLTDRGRELLRDAIEEFRGAHPEMFMEATA